MSEDFNKKVADVYHKMGIRNDEVAEFLRQRVWKDPRTINAPRIVVTHHTFSTPGVKKIIVSPNTEKKRA